MISNLEKQIMIFWKWIQLNMNKIWTQDLRFTSLIFKLLSYDDIQIDRYNPLTPTPSPQKSLSSCNIDSIKSLSKYNYP